MKQGDGATKPAQSTTACAASSLPFDALGSNTARLDTKAWQETAAKTDRVSRSPPQREPEAPYANQSTDTHPSTSHHLLCPFPLPHSTHTLPGPLPLAMDPRQDRPATAHAVQEPLRVPLPRAPRQHSPRRTRHDVKLVPEARSQVFARVGGSLAGDDDR